jgi:hypothetical protein
MKSIQNKWCLGDVVDLTAYPIDKRHTLEYKNLVNSVRKTLDVDSCVSLAGFIREDRLPAIVEEANSVKDEATYNLKPQNPYFSEMPDDVPEDDPRRYQGKRTQGFVRSDYFDKSKDLWQVYTDPDVIQFVADCVEVNKLYYYEDPFGALNMSVQKKGDEFHWHYDTNDFTVTMMLQRSEGGGRFEINPNTRSAKDERYENVKKIIREDFDKLISYDLDPGAFQIFRGRYGMHRVTPVTGDTPRLIAVLSYVLQEGMYASPERSMQVWNEVHPLQVEAQRRRADGLLD